LWQRGGEQEWQRRPPLAYSRPQGNDCDSLTRFLVQQHYVDARQALIREELKNMEAQQKEFFNSSSSQPQHRW
jgi:hypothetical protein